MVSALTHHTGHAITAWWVCGLNRHFGKTMLMTGEWQRHRKCAVSSDTSGGEAGIFKPNLVPHLGSNAERTENTWMSSFQWGIHPADLGVLPNCPCPFFHTHAGPWLTQRQSSVNRVTTPLLPLPAAPWKWYPFASRCLHIHLGSSKFPSHL